MHQGRQNKNNATGQPSIWQHKLPAHMMKVSKLNNPLQNQGTEQK